MTDYDKRTFVRLLAASTLPLAAVGWWIMLQDIIARWGL